VEQGGTIGNGHGRRNRGILQGRPADFLQLIFPSIDHEACKPMRWRALIKSR
jgi:hypothetical protein